MTNPDKRAEHTDNDAGSRFGRPSVGGMRGGLSDASYRESEVTVLRIRSSRLDMLATAGPRLTAAAAGVDKSIPLFPATQISGTHCQGLLPVASRITCLEPTKQASRLCRAGPR